MRFYPPGVYAHCTSCGFFFYTGMPQTHLTGCEQETDPRAIRRLERTSRKQEPGFTANGWHCWTGPSGTRYAAPGNDPSTIGVLSAYSDLTEAPDVVRRWLGGTPVDSYKVNPVTGD